MSSFVTPNMIKSLERHALKAIHKSDQFQCYRMGRPGTGIYAVYITFMCHGADPAGVTPRGKMIVLTGDISFCDQTNAVASHYGYDFEWFSDQLSERYLCEKFLRKCWSKEAAMRDIKDEAREIRENKESDAGDLHRAGELETLARDIEVGEMGEGDVYNAYMEINRTDDYDIGYDYPLAEAGWLCAVQQKFRELLPMIS